MDQQQLNFKFYHYRRLPIILQTETAECGLACLAMISNYWGQQAYLFQLRRRFAFSLRGATLKNIVEVADALSLNSRPLRLELNQLKQLKCPCILHWDMRHFVVLKKVTRNAIIIHDPAIGICKVPLEQASHRFTGIALELSPKSEFKKQKQRQKISFLSVMGNIEGLKRGLFQILLLGIMLQICIIIAPFYLQWIVDDVIVTNDENLLTVLALGFFLLVLLRTAIEAVRAWVTTVLSTQLNFQWLGNVFAHVLRLPLEWFQSRHLGDIVSRFHSVQQIQEGLTTKVVASVVDGVLVITTLIMMFIYNSTLATISFVAILLYGLLRWFAFQKQRYVTSEYIVNRASQESHFLESIRGMQSIRLYNHQKERYIGWTNALAKEFNAHLFLEKINISFQAANTFLFNTERIIIIWVAALLILDNQFSVGMLFAFMSYKEQLSDRIVSLIDKYSEIAMLKLHAERLADVVFSPVEEEPKNLDSSIELNKLKMKIELKNISFQYSEHDPMIIKGLNLVILPGQSVAFTGASGCGKTTLLKIILGLLTPTGGTILIDDIPISRIGIARFRNLIGTVMQEDHLFAGTIADNICFFDAEPDQTNIEWCAKLAAIHDEIAVLPMGYNTSISDIGTGLSGGQRQRVLLARALYRRPKILALDEATSHLDVENEKLVNQAVKKLDLTKIIIAHRQETIAMADRVLILDQGTIVYDSEEKKVSNSLYTHC